MKKILLIVSLFSMLTNAVGNSQNKIENKKNSKELVCIDPGHQLRGNSGLEEIAPGSSKKKAKVSSGTRGVATKKYEYELTLEIGLKIKEKLEKKGYKTFMTRESHNVNISNKERSLATNKMGCSVYIRLHADGNDNKSINGASVLTSSSKNIYTKKVQKESEKFSKILLEEYIKSTGARNRGISYRDDLTGTNWSTVVNTLIEMGFMSNEIEDKKMSTVEYQNKMVDGIVRGIERYIEEK